jgi:hypothetical protein
MCTVITHVGRQGPLLFSGHVLESFDEDDRLSFLQYLLIISGSVDVGSIGDR